MGSRWHPRELHFAWLHTDCAVSTIFVLSARENLAKCRYRTQKILDDNPDLQRQWTSLIPQGQMGSPQDLMGPVTFLLSDAANYVTGADLRVDGGYTVT